MTGVEKEGKDVVGEDELGKTRKTV
jgi:hypothetical protein